MIDQSIEALFPDNYDESRSRFREGLDSIRQHWPAAKLHSHALADEPGYTIDRIEAPATEAPDRCVIVTTGEHGIEGYVGSAMLELFEREFVPRLSAGETSLLLVHAINPWGMAHRRRVNANNVDLNRNFVREGERRGSPEIEALYGQLSFFFQPQGAIGPRVVEDGLYGGRLLLALARAGARRLRAAALTGQYRSDRGIYFGGDRLQEEAQLLQGLYRQCLADYPQVVLLDMHTGYGPRYQMSIVNSAFEPRSSELLERQYGYPLVVKANPEEFYAIAGDMIDYVYQLREDQFPSCKLYAASFEFGTYGDSTLAGLRSLRATIDENRMHWHGSRNAVARRRVERAFHQLFFPSNPSWRAKAVSDARLAFEGILRAEGALPSG